MKSWIAAGLLASFAPAVSEAQEIVVTAPSRLMEAPAVPDRVLATLRGGILLDNGFNLALGVDIQTRVDGLLVLHTIYASDGPTAGVRVYTDGLAGERIAPGTTRINMPGQSTPATIVVDRSPTGTTIAAGGASQGATVNLVSGDPGTWLNANGQTSVPVTEGGPSISEGPGTFTVTRQAQGAVVTLDASMLQIRHLIGQATGLVIANTANDRSIDTVSSINVDLQGVSPALLAGLFAADQLAFDAMSRR